ncbi:MAG: branched-chain amino acid aminotransferase [Clostridia bacterium]
MLNIKIEKTKTPREKPDQSNLGFGNYFSDHMFIMDYTEGKGWHDARIVPYQSLVLDPAATVLHYSQEVFEGLKAYRTDKGDIQLFRPEVNIERMNISNERLGIPLLNIEDGVQAIKAIVKADIDWVPSEKDTSLYIRPFIIGTEAFLGVRSSKTFQFIIILSPVGAYYPEGLNPVKIYVENEYVRSVKGGVGFTKTGGNYAASIKSQMEAKEKNYSQVLWLDGVHRKYIEEVGTMNVFFKIDGKIITPALEGSILSGVTRRSCIELLRTFGLEVEERRLSIDEVVKANDEGKLEEAFGTGTAAVISPIGELNYSGKVMIINNGEIGEVSQKLYDTLTGIQWGKLEDTFNWTTKI